MCHAVTASAGCCGASCLESVFPFLDRSARATVEGSTDWRVCVQVRRFSRYNLGEGMEKKSNDFAAEVAAQTGQA